MSRTREKFVKRKKARRKQRADDAYIAEHTLICQGTRRRHGKENQFCEWPIRFRVQHDGANAQCKRCGQLHRSYGGKWYRAEGYEIAVHDAKKLEREAQEGDYGHNPYYAPWETPAHEPDCGYKDMDLLGLRRTERKTTGGPGVIKIGIAMVDRQNLVRHWCRPAKQ